MALTEVEQLRDLLQAFWEGREMLCPRHPGTKMKGTHVQTTYADHVYLECPKGKETHTIPQRPRQQEFNHQQSEGLVENVNRGDNILCYRCQSKLEKRQEEDQATGRSRFTFTCVRCLSWGSWEGRPQDASMALHSAAVNAKDFI